MIRLILFLTIILSNTILSETIKRDVYKLKHRDELQFKILNNKYKYNSNLIVSFDGFIDIKYIGYIYVNGKSIKEIKDLILKMYKKDYKLILHHYEFQINHYYYHPICIILYS